MSFFKGLKRFTANVIGFINVVAVALMLITGFSDHIDPVAHPSLSCMGLTFPFFIVINLGFLAFWALFSLKRVLIPFVGFLLCYGPVRTYCPLNVKGSEEEPDLKIVSYNIAALSANDDMEIGRGTQDAYRYIEDCGADIVCVQEAPMKAKWTDRLREEYPYIEHHMNPEGNAMALLSRFPVKQKQVIRYTSLGANLSALYTISVNGRDVHVFNCHLETAGLTIDERKQFRNMVYGREETDTVQAKSRQLLSKLGYRNMLRARQVDIITAKIDSLDGERIILCGDFNDTPISWAHHQMAERLTDCYRETALGPGWTFHSNAIRVRIDHVFCSANITPVSCKTDRSATASDHYPMVCTLKIDAKTQK